MRKKGKRFGILLAAALILICLATVPAQAAEGDYTYTVRFYAGQQGTFAGGQNVITFEGLSYGSTVTFNPGAVTLNNDSKYYVKGIRESGKDNSTVSASSFRVEGDRDYVVAYGLRGNMVAYTVGYVDVAGKELAPTETYYGNVGDKPVVAFLYIEGYQPQAYNLTKTLVENEAENEFVFVYEPLSGIPLDTTVTTTVVQGGERSVVEVIPGTRQRGIGMSRMTDSRSGNADGSVGTRVQTQPWEVMDLDNMEPDGIYLEDPAVPLADMKFKIGPIEMDARALMIMLVIIVDIFIILAVSYWYWKPYRKKAGNEEENASQPV